MSVDRSSSDRWTEILEAAIRVLARDGLAQASTRKLAAEAGINQATLLYHVGSKDELLLAVLREMMRQTREIAVAAATEDLPLREAIASSLRAFWRHVEATPELQVMQYELTLYALRNPEAAWLAREQYSGYCEVVEGVLRAASEREGTTCTIPFDALARFIVGGLDGLILQFVSDQNTARARCDLEALIAAVIALADGSAPVNEPPPPEGFHA
ncbi:MAG TPA: TetR/AcrR family transcriptional regulator [Ktedonobacterales bacterium]|nr:TetR/AcrR family transcriptional regulator [Ktedonobacterales bacterium]